MFDEKLREEVVKILGMEEASEEEQDVALSYIENIANKRFARAIPEMLSEEQLQHVGAMQDADEGDEKIVDWIKEQIPQHQELLDAVILDVAEEIAQK